MGRRGRRRGSRPASRPVHHPRRRSSGDDDAEGGHRRCCTAAPPAARRRRDGHVPGALRRSGAILPRARRWSREGAAPEADAGRRVRGISQPAPGIPSPRERRPRGRAGVDGAYRRPRPVARPAETARRCGRDRPKDDRDGGSPCGRDQLLRRGRRRPAAERHRLRAERSVGPRGKTRAGSSSAASSRSP